MFDVDYIVVPVNPGAHWLVAIVCYPQQRYQTQAVEGYGRESAHAMHARPPNCNLC